MIWNIFAVPSGKVECQNRVIYDMSYTQTTIFHKTSEVLPSLKLTAKAPESHGGKGKRSNSFWEFTYFQGLLLLVSGSVYHKTFHLKKPL